MNKKTTLREDDKKYFWHPWSSNYDTHPILASGKFCYVIDIYGNKYIDATSAALNASCGICNRIILNKTFKQMKRLTMFDTKCFSVIPAIELAKLISNLLPNELCKSFFCNSGSEAVETAVKIAISYNAIKGTGKEKICTFTNGYHGSTVVASYLSGSRFINSNNINVNLIHNYIDLSQLMTSTRSQADKLIESAINRNTAGEIAAFICEPILGVGGFIFPHVYIIQKIYDLCKSNGILFIFDETLTSFGRTGKMFAFEHYEIIPDILITGKGISNAVYPLSAVTTTQNVYNAFSNDSMLNGFRSGHTNSGHASACCACINTIEYIVKHNLVTNSERIGNALLTALMDLSTKYKEVSNVRGLGLLVAFDLPDECIAKELFNRCYENGLIVRVNGKSVGLLPPLNIKTRHVKEIIKKLSLSLSEITSTYLGGHYAH